MGDAGSCCWARGKNGGASSTAQAVVKLGLGGDFAVTARRGCGDGLVLCRGRDGLAMDGSEGAGKPQFGKGVLDLSTGWPGLL
ncbi:hypothetical protein M0R45_005438 [Rubus argutus]|uniref:Uncharacterized protein n=1 Tax=Rubus argutus TaxID=59490 RepID=A0AAW1YMV4_RUBAR